MALFGSPQEPGARTAADREEARKERERRRSERRGEPLPASEPEERLPEERLPEERLPEERLPEERLPEERLPEERLPEERAATERDARVDERLSVLPDQTAELAAVSEGMLALGADEGAKEGKGMADLSGGDVDLGGGGVDLGGGGGVDLGGGDVDLGGDGVDLPDEELDRTPEVRDAPSERLVDTSRSRRTPQQRLPPKVAGSSRAGTRMRTASKGAAAGGKARGQRSKKRVAASGLRAGADAGKGKARGPRTRKAVIARAGAVGSLALVGVLVWLLVSIFQPFHGAGHGKVVIVIPKDTSAGGVGSILADHGVVSSGFFFEVRTLIDGKRGELHAGRYVMKHDMSYSEAIAALTGQVPHVAVTKVVIPEGETRGQIASIAKKDGLKGDYMAASKRVPGFNPGIYGAPKGTPNLEGFLFPATYEVDVHANVSSLVSEQLEAFHERLSGEYVSAARRLSLTPYELVIVASMIEREAKLPKDRPRIAAVIYNRLRLGMPLGIDATIRYALNDWEKPLTESQLHVNSPYNTRLHKGLPPTPISNPGLESIEAAAHPARVGYLYYVNGSDGCGDLVFSSSYAEFEHDTALYEEALAANGGKEPTCKHS